MRERTRVRRRQLKYEQRPTNREIKEAIQTGDHDKLFLWFRGRVLCSLW